MFARWTPAAPFKTLLPAGLAAALAGGAAVYAVGPEPGPPPGRLAPAVAPAVGTMATAVDARELSGVFRTVAERVMPAVVAVEAEVPARQPNVRRFRRGQSPQFQGPRGEMRELDPQQFQDLMRDPLFRRFFEGQPGFRGFDDFERDLPDGFRNERNQFRRPGKTSQGSGVVIDPSGLILTNNHVVEGAETVTVRFENGESYVAEEVATDPDTDIAVLRLNPDDLAGDLPSVELGDSDATHMGDWVLAFGSPLGQRFSMTAGIVSGTGRIAGLSPRENYLQHDAAINPGNSGGPLVNLDGEIVGINTAITSRGGGYDGIGLAVPANDARWVADQLAETGEVSRAFLGVTMQPEIDEATAEALGLPGTDGVLVTKVEEDSPAERAGVRVGDVVVELNGEAVDSTRVLRRRVEKLTVGEDYPLVVIRDGVERSLTLSAGALDDAALARADVRPRRRSGRLNAVGGLEVPGFGVSLAPVDDRARGLFDLPADARGAVVIEADAAARAAGLRPGTLVTRLGSQDLTGEIDLEDAVDAAVEKTTGGLLMLVGDGADRRFVTLEPAE